MSLENTETKEIEVIYELQSNGNIIIKRRKPFFGMVIPFLSRFVDWWSPSSDRNRCMNEANELADKLIDKIIELDDIEKGIKDLKKYIEAQTKGRARMITDIKSYTIRDKKQFKFKELFFVDEPPHRFKEILKSEIYTGKAALNIMQKWSNFKGSSQSGTATKIVPNVDEFIDKSINHNTFGDGCDGIDDVIKYKQNQGNNKGGKNMKKGPFRKKRPHETQEEHQARLQRIDSGNPEPGDMDEP